RPVRRPGGSRCRGRPWSSSKTWEKRGFLGHRVRSADYRHHASVISTALAQIGRCGTPGVMVRAMAFDRGALSRVAWLMLISACGPSVKPPSPPPEPEPVTKQEPEGPIDPSVRRVVLGEMCPQ